MGKRLYTKEETGLVPYEVMLAEEGAGLNDALTGLAGELAGLASDGLLATWTHSRTAGGVHNLAGSGHCGKVKITAAFEPGDTFAVNGEPVTAYAGAEEAEELPVGRWVMFVYDPGDHTLHFPGTGNRQLRLFAVSAPSGLPGGLVREGYVAVVTPLAPGSVSVQPEEPPSPAHGDLWAVSGRRGANPVKLGQSTLYLANVYQYVDGTGWVYRAAYRSGPVGWRKLVKYLFYYGHTCAPITGGYRTVDNTNSRTLVTDDAISFDAHGTSSAGGGAQTANQIDLTGYQGLHFRTHAWYWYNTTYAPRMGYGTPVLVYANSYTAALFSGFAALGAAQTAPTVTNVDISAASGSFYVAVNGVWAGICDEIWLTE